MTLSLSVSLARKREQYYSKSVTRKRKGVRRSRKIGFSRFTRCNNPSAARRSKNRTYFARLSNSLFASRSIKSMANAYIRLLTSRSVASLSTFDDPLEPIEMTRLRKLYIDCLSLSRYQSRRISHSRFNFFLTFDETIG